MIKTLLRRQGIEIIRTNKPDSEFGLDASADCRRILHDVEAPVIFDIGANCGQTVERMLRLFPAPRLHCFEPSPATFARRQSAYASRPGVTLNNIGLGSSAGVLDLIETEVSEYSSFLEMDALKVPVVARTPMRISTVDAYCEEHGIEHIHVLKSDTQGFDYEVFCGADRMLSIGAVSLAYLELIMDDEYSDVDRYDSIFTLWRTEATEYKVFTARYGDTAACAGLMSCS